MLLLHRRLDRDVVLTGIRAALAAGAVTADVVAIEARKASPAVTVSSTPAPPPRRSETAAGLTPLRRAVLPAGTVAGRHGRYVAYHPFHVCGAPYGGLAGPVTDAARLALLHLGDGTVDGVRLLSASAAAEMRKITASGGPVDVGLGWCRPSRAPGFVEHVGGGSCFFAVMRLYPDRRLGIVTMANTTRYHHAAVLDAIAQPSW